MTPRNGTVLRHLFMAFAVIGIADTTLGQSCVTVPESSPNPVVSICTTETQYTFRIGSRSRSFEREFFKAKLTRAATDWFLNHDIPIHTLNAASGQIWMTVPEVNPEAAQPRFVVTTHAGSVSFWFDLWSDVWEFSDEETAVFGDRAYPESFGFRPQTVLVQAKPGVRFDQVKTALMNCGANQVVDRGDGWFYATATLFEETALAANARKSQSMIIKTAQVNSVMEWIATRKMALTFVLDPESGDEYP